MASHAALHWTSQPSCHVHNSGVTVQLHCCFSCFDDVLCACRSNLSYGRYNEGRTYLQTFTSKLTDVVTLAMAFDHSGALPHACDW